MFGERLEKYSQYHQNRVNKLLHLIGMPVIIMGILLPLLRGELAWGILLFIGSFLLWWGHKFEGNKPMLIEEPLAILIAPLWYVTAAFRMVTGRKKLVWVLLLLPLLAQGETKMRHRKGTGAEDPNAQFSDKVSNIKEVRPSERTPDGVDPKIIGLSNKGAAKGSGTCAQKHPIETYLQISSNFRPQTKKGGGVYFLSDLREAPQLFFLSGPGNWPEQVSFFPDGVPYFAVSPDGQKILIATHQGGDEQYDLYLLEVKKKLLTPLMVDRKKRIESVKWDPSSKWFAYTANTRNGTDFDLYRWDLAEGKGKLLAEIPGHHSVTDISLDGNLIAVTEYRSVTDSDVLVWDQKAGKAENVTRDATENVNQAGVFSADSKNVLYVSDNSGEFVQLYTLNLASKKSKQLTFAKWDIEDFVLDDKKGALLYSFNEDGYSRLEGYSLDATGKKTRILALPKIEQKIAGSFSFSPDHGRNSFFLTFASPADTSDVWHFGPKLVRWTESTRGFIDPTCFAREKLVRYTTFDGVQIPAFLFLPTDYPAAGKHPIPFIVYVHGGPESQTRPYFSKTFQYFLQRGFGILAPNIRGSTGYGKTFTTLDNYKKRMDSVKDVVEGGLWLIKERYTKAGQIAIYGGSYGGFLVLRTIEVAPELFSAASSSVGIANFVTFLKNTKPYRRALREVEYGPLTDEEFLKSISPMTYVDQIRTPLLLFHGANDPRVPVGETEQIVEALKRRDIPVEHKIFSDEGHGNAKLKNIMEQGRQMVFFFEKHLSIPK